MSPSRRPSGGAATCTGQTPATKEGHTMPLRLNVGVSKKLGLPEFSSVGASCNLELELDAMLIHTDLDGLHEQIRGAFVAARQAVDDELARFRAQEAPPAVA